LALIFGAYLLYQFDKGLYIFCCNSFAGTLKHDQGDVGEGGGGGVRGRRRSCESEGCLIITRTT
jgi:hypothetical protein